MKKILVALVLTIVIAFALGSSTLAAPLAGAEAGSLFAFGEYAPALLFIPANFAIVGVGYGLSDNITIGAEMQLLSGGSPFGGFAVLTFDALSLSGEFLTDGTDILGKVSGLYSFDLDSVKVGVGGGMFFYAGDSAFFAEGSASMAAGDNFSIYGAFDYYLDGWSTFKAGAAFSF